MSEWRARDRCLRDLGIDVMLVSSKSWNEGGSVVHLSPGEDTFVLGVRTLGRHPYRFAYDPIPILKLLRRTRFDVIDVHEEAGSIAHLELRLLARLSGHRRVPMLCYGAQNIEKRYPIPFRWFERSALKRCSAAHVCNARAGEIYQAKGLAGTAKVIGLGVDIDAFAPSTGTPCTDRQRGLDLLYVGRLEEHKGVQIALEAIVDTPHRLHIYGAGPYEAALRALAKPLGDRVIFHGPVDHGALPKVYATHDALVVPSQIRPNWIEQFGRIVVEAMACGLPVIAAKSGSLPEVVDDAGILVEPDKPSEWIQAIDRLMAEPGLRTTLAQSGVQRARLFAWPHIAREHAALYRDIAIGHR